MSQNLLDIQLRNAGYTLTKPRKVITQEILKLTSGHREGDICCDEEEINHSHSFASEQLVSSVPNIGRELQFLEF
ncbi:MAG: hypothetical protein ACJ0G8_01360 [Dehalococcoidia bacterium]